MDHFIAILLLGQELWSLFTAAFKWNRELVIATWTQSHELRALRKLSFMRL